MGQAERRQPGERHDVGAQPDHQVDQLHRRLHQAGPPAAGLGREAGEGQRQPGQPGRAARRQQSALSRACQPAAASAAPRKTQLPAIPDGAYSADRQPPSRHRLITPSAYAPASRTAPTPAAASSSVTGWLSGLIQMTGTSPVGPKHSP